MAFIQWAKTDSPQPETSGDVSGLRITATLPIVHPI